MVSATQPDPAAIDRLTPARRPAGPSLARQRWRQLLFLHWEVPAAALQARLPAPLVVDTFQERAYVGLIALTMPEVRLCWLPSMPPLTRLHSLNLRTYVHRDGREPGVRFFSLDTTHPLAVIAGRLGWRLPYHLAAVRRQREGRTLAFRSRRLLPGPRPAQLVARCRVGAALGAAQPGTLEHFLVERYLLYADCDARGLRVGQVHHPPFALYRAGVESLDETMLRAAGLDVPRTEPLAHYCPGVDAELFGLRA